MKVTKQFITAGDAIITISCPDGTHHTYRVQHVEANDKFGESWFAKLLTGPDNTSDYRYLGKLDDYTGQVRATAKSCRAQDAIELRLLNRVLARVWGDDHAAFESHGYQLIHEGRCGRCGRTLAVPESVEEGLGPDCRKIMGLPALNRRAKQDEARLDQMARDDAHMAGAY